RSCRRSKRRCSVSSRAPTACAATAASPSPTRGSTPFHGRASASPARKSRRPDRPSRRRYPHVQKDELQQLLTELAAERGALIERQGAGARAVSHYDFNNTYQYVIAREETHLTWLANALAELGAALPKASAALPVPAAGKIGKKVDPAAFKSILEDDV